MLSNGWNDKPASVQIPDAYDISVWQHHEKGGWKKDFYGEEYNGTPVCQSLGVAAYQASHL